MLTADAIIAGVIEREGGYVNDPDDAGGPTKYGITLQTLREWRHPDPVPLDQLKALTVEDAAAIYRRRYVEAPGYADAIADPRLLALVVDYAVHSGPRQATQGLQDALGLTADGVLGQATRAALRAKGGDPAVYKRLLAHRLAFIVRLVLGKPRQAKYLNGWLARVTDFL